MNAGKVRLTVLLVEDNPHDAELVLHELRRSGFEPVSRRVDTEAEYLDALDGTIDLILADYTLPSFSAPRALDLLMNRGLDLPFIIVTGTVGEDPALECIRKGADDYLIKDRLGRLPMAVRAALASRALRAERQSADDRTRLQARLLDAVEHAVVATNLNGTITYWNAAAERLYGSSAEEALGRHLLDVAGMQLDPSDADDILARLASGQNWSGEFTLHRKDGPDFLVHVSQSPICDAGGRVIGATTISHDITDQRRAEAALRESEQRLRTITDHMLDLVSQVKLDGTFVYVSPSHERVLGYRPHELVGTSAFDLMHPDDLAAIRPRIDAAISGCTAERFTFRCRRKDGRYVRLDTAGQVLLGATGIPAGAVLSAREASESQGLEAAAAPAPSLGSV